MTNDVKDKWESGSQFFDNQLLTVEKLSRFLDVPAATIRDWVYRRKIPFRKVGRLVRFVMADISNWLESGKKDANRGL